MFLICALLPARSVVVASFQEGWLGMDTLKDWSRTCTVQYLEEGSIPVVVEEYQCTTTIILPHPYNSNINTPTS